MKCLHGYWKNPFFRFCLFLLLSVYYPYILEIPCLVWNCIYWYRSMLLHIRMSGNFLALRTSVMLFFVVVVVCVLPATVSNMPLIWPLLLDLLLESGVQRIELEISCGDCRCQSKPQYFILRPIHCSYCFTISKSNHTFIIILRLFFPNTSTQLLEFTICYTQA